ncbi:lytic transglycosylase domain-containing protein [Leptolyngbya sp. FACHB-36]|uniref:transglycosylase SLT domain-containing protein n=1 Tax=Leptolyngbya sp. FACHB-36 TaxID=2692808 RepID=UPI001680D779|nr:transglycosylase SLT domain-containing protein [Leptolyngbya sp. FACHB-36]MBD2020551.1 lytic transglycosylase domain-containing protein [Leptolyngbya sp. FACHB-36]
MIELVSLPPNAQPTESITAAPVPVAIEQVAVQPETTLAAPPAMAPPESLPIQPIVGQTIASAAPSTPDASNTTDAITARRQVLEQRLAEIVRQKRQQQAAQLPAPVAPVVSPGGSTPVRVPSKAPSGSAGSKALSRDAIATLPYDLEVQAMLRAIVAKESSGNHRAVNPHSGALGFGQIMPELLRPWSREALGRAVSRSEFLNSPSLQVQIIAYRLNRYWQSASASSNGDESIAVRKVASLWYSGRANLFNSTTPQYYRGHRYPSIADYTLNVWRRYQLEKEALAALSGVS